METVKFEDKTLVKSFQYSDVNEDRFMCNRVIIDGRVYYKTGIFQVTTCVGNMFKVGPNKYVLYVGMAKQNPGDSVIDKKLAIEVANTKSYTDPSIIMKVSREFNNRHFQNIISKYVDSTEVDFIKTRQELLKQYTREDGTIDEKFYEFNRGPKSSKNNK